MQYNYDRNVVPSDKGAFVTHCPGDATRYTFFITLSETEGKKVVHIFPWGEGASLNRYISVEENSPMLEKINIEVGSVTANVNVLAKEYPSFRDRFSENIWTYAEALMLAKRALICKDLSEIVY